MSTRHTALDSRIEIVTPENVAFHYVVAGPFRRLPAFLVDVVVRAIVIAAIAVFVMFTMAAGAGGFGIGMLLVAWFVLSWFYGGLFETLWNGQTPGKRLFGLRVLGTDGQPINALQAVLRNVLRDADAMPYLGFIPLYVIGLGTTASNPRYQRLGDLAAGTIVVVEERSRLAALPPVDDPRVIELAERLPPAFPISRSMAGALSAYESRRVRFAPARRAEIASVLAEPLAQRLGLPVATDPDLLLRAMYYRAFIAERPVRPAQFEATATISEVAAV